MSESAEFERTHYVPKSEREKEKHELPAVRRRTRCCEECEYYDYDEEYDGYRCMMSLDEDEMLRFLSGRVSSCPYYKYYDEYKSVHKQI